MKYTRKIIKAFAAAVALMAVSCGEPEPNPTPQPGPDPTPQDKVIVANPTVSNIESGSATVKSSTELNASEISMKGFVYSLQENPTMSASRKDVSGPDFTATIDGLKGGQTYHVRAFVMASGKTTYSDDVSFDTPKSGNLDDYAAPAQKDDYRSIADWNKRGEWNLANVHDPSVVLADDGYYYMYQTDASYGNAHDGHGHFHGRRSKDLINWEYLGATMQSAPSWLLEKCNEFRSELGLPAITEPQYGYWAPCVRKVKVDGQTIYRMYYSIILDNYIGNGKPVSTTFDGTWTERAFIGVMETADPADNNSWEDKGFVICSSSDLGKNWKRSSQSDWNGYFKFNAIDPSYIVTPEGEHWLIYGSWHSGIAAVELDPKTGKTKAELPSPWGTADEIAPYGKMIESRGGRWQGSEGPEIIYRNGFYYLFVAYDELSVAYNTRVLRSENVDGPYVDINGSNAIDLGQAYPIATHPYKFSNSNGWVGISHCAVFDDGNDNWFYCSQARFPENGGGNAPNAVMLGHVRRIVWTEDEWPLVLPERYGAVPQIEISEDEIAGDWEHIDLSYAYREQKSSSKMSFGADGKVSDGPWKGSTWTFDPTKNIVKISNGVNLYVSRECDWESSPRKATLVYAAIGKNKTYWGKKSM